MSTTAPTQPRSQSAPFNLIGYFFVASFILITLVTVVVSFISTELATHSLVEQKTREGFNIARNLTRPIFNHILASQMVSEQSTPAVFAAVPAVPQLDAFIKERALGLGVVKVNIFDRQGKAVYSSDPETVGIRSDERQGFEAALNGAAWAELEHDEIRMFDGSKPTLDVVEVYSPLRSLFVNDTTDAIVGVFEVYLNVGNEFAPQIAEAQQRALFTTLGVMGLRFVGLLLIVLRADRVIRSSHRQLVARERELVNLSEENARLYAITRPRRLDEQNLLLDYSQSLLRTLDPQEILDRAGQTMVDLVPASCATVWLPDLANAHVRLAAEHGWSLPQGREPFVESDTSLPALTIYQRQPVEIANLADARGFSLGAGCADAGWRARAGRLRDFPPGLESL